MVKYWAKEGEMKRIRLRLRKTNRENQNGF
jgi:hypothetical protein